MEKLKKEIKRLNENVEFVKFLSAEEDERLYLNSLKQDSFDKGISQGITQGTNQRNIEIAKNMLKENADINFISKVTGLSVEEIENLK